MDGPQPFYQNPHLAAGLSNLTRLFVGDPNRELRAAQTEGARATARLHGVQADEVGARMTGARSLAEQFQRGFGEDRDGAARALYAAAAQDPHLLAQLPAALRGYAASQSGTTPSQLAALFQGAGGSYAQTQPGVEAHDLTLRRGQDVSAGAQLGSARIHAGSQERIAAGVQAGADRRFAPEINPGNVVVVPPNSPIAGRADAAGRIQGNASLPVQQGLAAALLIDPNTPEPQRQAARTVLPGVGAAEIRAADPTPGGRTPAAPVVGATQQRAIDAAIDDNSNDRDGAFALAPAARAAVQRRAAQLFQADGPTRGNATESAAAAMDEFMTSQPRRTDSSLNPLSSRTFDVPLTAGTAGGSGANRPPPPGGNQPPVLTPEQARQQPPGTVFRTPDGRVMRVPGA